GRRGGVGDGGRGVNVLREGWFRIGVVFFFFFFSSRRRHTRWPRDWSSDVCSSDLADVTPTPAWSRSASSCWQPVPEAATMPTGRSEERRVGKECRSRWSPDQ